MKAAALNLEIAILGKGPEVMKYSQKRPDIVIAIDIQILPDNMNKAEGGVDEGWGRLPNSVELALAAFDGLQHVSIKVRRAEISN